MEQDRIKKLSVTHTAARTIQEEEPQPKADRTKKVTVHAVICICVLCGALLIRSVDTPLTDSLREGITTALTFDIDAEETLGRLRFVHVQLEETVTAFAAQGDVRDSRLMPVQGAVLRQFGEKHPCVMLNVQAEQPIVCPASGVITDVTEDAVAIDFEDSTAGMLCGLGQVVVQKGTSVFAGDKIAQADEVGTPITFYIYENGKPIDPVQWAAEE